MTYEEGKDDCGTKGTNESFPSLLGRNANQRSSSSEETPNESSNVVTNDQRSWQQKPDQSVEDVSNVEGRWSNSNEGHSSPDQLLELELVESALESQHKGNNT